MTRMLTRTLLASVMLATVSLTVPAGAEAATSTPTGASSGGTTSVGPLAAQPGRPADLPANVPVHSFSYGPGTSLAAAKKNGVSQINATAAAPWVCTVFASDPYKNSIGEIAGDGWQSCAGAGYAPQRITLSIQKNELGVVWKSEYTYKTGSTSSDWMEASAYTKCGSTGKYRIVTTGYAEGGAYLQSVQSLNDEQIKC